ncbi:replication protein, partial [Enterococcus faecium]|nr:replication protein [Enterococcus faecium]
MSKKGTIINEWEKLTALSNRRLNVQNLNTPLKLQWSIDRITIAGKLKENSYYHTPID